MKKETWGEFPGQRLRDDAKDVGAITGREVFQLRHNPDNGIIELTGTVVGCIKTIQMPSYGVVKERVMNVKSLTEEEDKSVRMDTMELILEDILSFTKTTIDALEKRLGRDIILSKVVVGDVWKTATSGSDFIELVRDIAKVDSNVNGYAFLTEFMAVSTSGESETILQEYPL